MEHSLASAVWDSFHSFMVGGLSVAPLSGDGGKGSMWRMLKRCSINHIIEIMEKGRVTAQAMICPVYVSVSAPKIVVDTSANISLSYWCVFKLRSPCWVVGRPVSVDLQHISRKGTLGILLDASPPTPLKPSTFYFTVVVTAAVCVH